jgi:hypothetical protein
MFQDCGIEEHIDACHAGIADVRYGDEYRAAVLRALQYWQGIQTKRITEPYDPGSAGPRVAGKYVIVRCTHHVSSDEWTNIGCLVYDQDGKQIFARMGPYDRAIARGDLHPEYAEHLDSYPKTVEHIEQVERSMTSLGHFMSSIQMTAPRPCILHEENSESIYLNFVLGLH